MPTVENSRIGLDDWLKNHIRSKLKKTIQQIQETKWASLCENCADFDSWQLPVVCWTDSFEQLCLQLWLDLLAIAEREVRLNCNGSLVSRQALLLTFSPFTIVVNRFTLMHKRHEYQIKSGQLSTTLHNSSIKNIKIFFVRLSNWNL